jgi:hypothetical protein
MLLPFHSCAAAAADCWEMPHLIHAAVAVGSLLIFLTLGLLDAMAHMELNPTSHNWFAMAHSQSEVRGRVGHDMGARLCQSYKSARVHVTSLIRCFFMIKDATGGNIVSRSLRIA